MRMGGRATRTVAAALLLPLLAASGPRAPSASDAHGVLVVFAAASLSEVFGEIARRAEEAHAGLSIRFNFAGSQQLVAQMEQGVGADVFASADERWMEEARARALLDGEPVVFARNRLVVIVPSANPGRIRRLQDLARRGVKLVLGADAVPVGRYSRIVLRDLSRDPAYGGNFATRALRNVVSEEENVKSVVGKVQLGEADAGIVYRSDVTPAVSRRVRVFEVPGSVHAIASYPIARLARAPHPGAAAAFVDLVLSREGQEILRRHGFLPGAVKDR